MAVHGKKALSPMIASLLLVSISLILAVIIFFWARSFLSESITKNDRDIQLECEDVDFDAEVFFSGGDIIIRVVNNGNVPLYGVDVRKRQVFGEVVSAEEFNEIITAGQTADLNLSVVTRDINVDDEIDVVPILLGETAEYRKAYVCDDSLKLTLKVSEG